MRIPINMNSHLPEISLYLIGHGSSKDQRAEKSLYMHAEKIEKAGRFKKVFVDFLKNGKEELQFGKEPLFVVPFFMSDGYFAQKKVPERVNQRIDQSQLAPSEIFYCPPLGSDPEIADIVLSMIREFCEKNKMVLDDCLSVLLAHGSPKSESAQQSCLEAGEKLKRKHRLNILPMFLETEPTFSSLQLEAGKMSSNELQHVIIVGMFASEGPHVTKDIPELVEAANLEYKEVGISVSYVGTLGLHPAVTALIEKTALNHQDC